MGGTAYAAGASRRAMWHRTAMHPQDSADRAPPACATDRRLSTAAPAGDPTRWTVVGTSLGPLFVAATERGICRVSFDPANAKAEALGAGETRLCDDPALVALAAHAAAAVERPERDHDLPLDLRGTPFQMAVWRELGRVPAGQTISYATLAARAGRPGAARAVGSACGANPLAVLIPCHRARRGDGSPGGYAWGLERKAELLRRESALPVP